MKSQIGLATVALGSVLFSYKLFLQTHDNSDPKFQKHKWYNDFDKEYDDYKMEIDNQIDF
ncbi:hypothetical protein CORT_0A12370 [Candida orthopsilosis Co 90-125]|uniref:Uncharacterized protein n=1 Tax=Candida orthopsilosis (strain 90-125) TaxID=1136231 RepID=H8WYZ0_CANO9|nr:hypothetical protein CORT_0A12370 [Candida orthopsilosis Co 90-125]CCG21622.1 hypothetical protein CORT_0A12370 [Candida orthopsilosis Co 90-125]